MKTRSVRFLSMLLAVLMIFSLLPMGAFAADGEDGPVTVIACSDFQNKTGSDYTIRHSNGAALVTSILNQMKSAGYTTADGFLCCGDYTTTNVSAPTYSGGPNDPSADEISAGLQALKGAVEGVYGTGLDEVFIQGNHDAIEQSSNGLSGPGANDTDNYGVFVIDEDDYMWRADTQEKDSAGRTFEQRVQYTAANLDDYLSGKLASEYGKPIFVISHLPLHFNMRVKHSGDGGYAKYIFNVLNKDEYDNLNIIFLYGHNHSDGWDDYLGGSEVFLEEGRSIRIANSPSQNSYTTETLNFTYMNAGYVGTYETKNTAAEQDLSMTVFTIREDQSVVIERFTASGKDTLGAAGVLNNTRGNDKNDNNANPALTAETTVTNKAIVAASPFAPNLKDNGVTVVSESGTALAAPYATNVNGLESNTDFAKYTAYDLTVTGHVTGETATVILPVPAEYTAALTHVYYVNNGELTDMNATISDGYAWFKTNHFSVYAVAQEAGAENLEWNELPGDTQYRLVSNGAAGIVAGNQYLIASGNSGSPYVLTSSGGRTQVAVTNGIITSNNSANEFKFIANGTNYYLQDSAGKYLFPTRNWIFFGYVYSITSGATTPTSVTVSGSSNVTIKNGNSYLRYNNGFDGSDSSSNLYLFAKEVLTGGYAALSGETAYTFEANEYESQAAIETFIRNHLKVLMSNDAEHTNPQNVDYTLSGTVNPGTSGEYTLTVSYNNNNIGSVTVNIVPARVVSVTASNNSSTVEQGSSTNTQLGTTIKVTRTHGAPESIPVTLDMLSGNYDVNTPATYTGLTLKYTVDGTEYILSNDYTLTVEPKLAWVTYPGQTTYKYTLDTDGINYNQEYLIVASNTNKALVMNGNSLSTRTVEINNNTITLDADTYDWKFTGSGSSTVIQYPANSRYLYNQTQTLSASATLNTRTSSFNEWSATQSPNGSGQYDIHHVNDPRGFYLIRYCYLYYTGSAFNVYSNTGTMANPYTVRLFRYDGTTTSPSTYAAMEASTVYVTRGISEQDLIDRVTNATTVWYNGSQANKNGATVVDPSACTFDYSDVHRDTNGTYTVPVSYNGQKLGDVTVVVAYVKEIKANGLEGTVEAGSPASAKTGTTITAVTHDGTESTVNVTVGMLSGNNLDINTPGTYTGLTITYDGKTIDGYTLVVTPKNEYPTFPNEGSVRVNKTASSDDFQDTGVAKVELSVTGVPVKKGIDVIVLVDTSSSVDKTVTDSGGNSTTRLAIMKTSIGNLLRSLQTKNTDGSDPDIKVAVVDFNSSTQIDKVYDVYDHGNNGDNLQRLFTHKVNGSISPVNVRNNESVLNEDAFLDVNTLTSTDINAISNALIKQSGTNYDSAFDAAYMLGAAARAADSNRDLVVVFMSDGAPYQYNYYGSSGGAQDWPKWLMGTFKNNDELIANMKGDGQNGTVNNSFTESRMHSYFYNGDGNRLRIAEAVKGDPTKTYEIISNTKDKYVNKSAIIDGDKQYLYNVPGLGATVYSIGFCQYVTTSSDKITDEQMKTLMKRIATSEEYFYSANNSAELNDVFATISNDIKYAATNARFVDTLGAGYDLQMEVYGKDGHTKTPSIQVLNYETYKTSQVGTRVNGELVTSDMVGKRTGTVTVLETVSFGKNDDGVIIASSTKYPNNQNIINNGVICAGSFWYNTNHSAVMIDTNGDGATDYSLAPETFYWNIGTVGESEIALSYYAYLTGSMDGSREAGSHSTNESAVLYYTNYLGNEAHKDTVSPRMPWKSAHVSYGFYLVDQNGNVLTNTSTGATGSFADKIAITNPIVFGEVLLNTSETIPALKASSVVPSYYELYDKSAVYNITIGSGSNPSNWEITKGTTKATTYVTDYNGTDFSNALAVNDPSYDYTHTIVWFAVKYQSGAMDDTVVIDYGLPVEISVLSNDMVPSNALVTGIATTDTGVADNKSNAAVAGTYGTLTVCENGQKLRYTLNKSNGMQMSEPEEFYYGVTVDGSLKIAKVIVIPATIVYYEDNFVTFDDSTTPDGDYGKWTGYAAEDYPVQAEDRPGTDSLLADANNIYGYDQAYGNYSQFSLDTYQKVTVNAATGTPANAPVASFTFTGTGFDVISLTDNTCGSILVTVKQGDKVVKRATVNNFYGYTYSGGAWTPGNNGAPDSICQVPVIKISDLAYGTYNVTIQVAYLASADVLDSKQCSFWLDAIRIYDPALTNKDANAAYAKDTEANPDFVRVKDLLISSSALEVDENITGIVFIDGITEVMTAAIADYRDYGPNNEAYLNNDQAIAFQLIANDVPKSVQIGAKLAAGSSATLNYNGKVFQTLDTATDMYYQLSGLSWTKVGEIYTSGIIILENTSTENAVISLTNIKITGGAQFLIAPAADKSVEETVQSADMPVVMAFASPRMASSAVTMVNEYNTPAIEAHPEILSVEIDSNDVKLGDTVTATIISNEDTDYIIVNGEVVDTFTVNNDGCRVWIYSFAAETAGSNELTVAACNNNGTMSENIVTVVSVAEPEPEPQETILDKVVEGIKTIFDKLFGWLKP